MSTKQVVLEKSTKSLTKTDVFLNLPSRDLEKQFDALLTSGAIEFLVHLIAKFEDDIDCLYIQRLGRKYKLQSTRQLPRFPVFSHVARTEWKVTTVRK